MDDPDVAEGHVNNRDTYPRKPPKKLIDWVMLLLAVVSAGLVIRLTFWDMTDLTTWILFGLDIAICLIFFGEFIYRMRKSGNSGRFVIRYWFDVLAMVPIVNPFLGAAHPVRWIVMFGRVLRVADRSIGDKPTTAVVNRLIVRLLDLIKRPITVLILDEVAKVLKGGHYTGNIARALEENQPEIDKMILEKIRDDPKMGKFRFVPFHDEIIGMVSDTTFRILFEVLDDPRTDELISDLIRENVDQIRDEVRAGEKNEMVRSVMSKFV